MADFADLDWAFTCPASVTDDDLRAGYEVLVARLRGEARYLPLNTVFQLQISIAIESYIKMRHAGRRQYGADGGFADPKQEKDYTIFVSGLLHEINDMLRKDHPRAAQEVTIGEIKEVLTGVMRGISDVNLRDDLSRRFATAFDRAGF